MITTVVADGKNEYEFIDLLKKRAQNSDKNVVPIVSEIIENVAENGDKAVKEYTVKFDGKAPEKVEITSDEIDSLIEKCDKDYLETIKRQPQILQTSIKDRFSKAGSQQRITA